MDLNGKTIGTSALRDLQHVAVLKWMDQNGGDSKTVRAVELGLFQAPPALVAGRVDAYPLVEPILTNEKDNFRIIAAPFDVMDQGYLLLMKNCLGAATQTASGSGSKWAMTPGDPYGLGMTMQVGRPDVSGTVQPLARAHRCTLLTLHILPWHGPMLTVL